MAEPFASSFDLAGLWRPLSDVEMDVASSLLEFASAVIRAQVPDVDTRVDDGSLDVALVRFTTVMMALRVLKNPEGRRSETTSIEDFTHSWTRHDSVSAGGLYLTVDELALLRSRKGGAFSVVTTSVPAVVHDVRFAAHRATRW